MYKYSVFRCPKCKQAILASSTKCKYCQSAVDVNAAHMEMLKGAIDYSLKQLKKHRFHIGLGGGSFLVGSVMAIAAYILNLNSLLLYCGLAGFGFLFVFYGIWSWLEEKSELRKLKKEIRESYDKFPYLKKSYI